MTYERIRAELAEACMNGEVYSMTLCMFRTHGVLSTNESYVRRWLDFSPLGAVKTHFEILNDLVYQHCCNFIRNNSDGRYGDALEFLTLHESESDYPTDVEYNAGLEIYLALQNDSYTCMAIDSIVALHFQLNLPANNEQATSGGTCRRA